MISVKLREPQFEGQTKTKLGNSEVAGQVSTVLSEALMQYLEENPGDGRKIIDQSLTAARARQAAAKARDLVQRKSLLESATLPGKLVDCSERDPAHCEIFIVEGLSAGGTAKEARERRNQAILPLRGKILNVEKARADKILGNEQIKDLIMALGGGFGETFSVDKLRYHRIVLMADADVDGSHIRTLLLTFFWRHLRPLVDGGYLYLAQPPLYKLEKGKGRNKQTEYAFSDDQRDEKAKSMGRDTRDLSLQGTRRDDVRGVVGDHDGSRAPRAAPGRCCRRAQGRRHLRPSHGLGRRAAQALHPDPRDERAQPRRLMPLPIAVDAMGGDNAPAAIVRGALRAVNEHGIAVTLVGRREAVEAELRSAGAASRMAITVVDAREVIEMNEHPANAVRAKRDSSLVSSCALVAGGTGARGRQRGQQRRDARRRAVHHQAHPGHRAACHRRSVPERIRPDIHARRRCQHGLQAGVAGAVRADGRRLRSHHARHRAPASRACSATARRPRRDPSSSRPRTR